MTVTVRSAGRTHVGMVRRRNEDAFHVGKHLVAVADGLGGHPAGDVASSLVINSIRSADRPDEPAKLADMLSRAIFDANNAVRAHTPQHPETANMATTLVALLRSGDAAVLANVGDSRAYLLRKGTLTQITEDHVFSRLVADSNAVPTLSDRLTRYLDGRVDGRSADISLWQLLPGDRFLLCTDGLSSYVSADTIREALTDGTADEAADRLVAVALDAGGIDNVTVVVVDVRAAPA